MQVITSSFGAITNPFKGWWPEHEYSEEDWNPLTQEQAVSNPARGYQGQSAPHVRVSRQKHR